LPIGKRSPIRFGWQPWSRSGRNIIGGGTVLNQDFKEFIQSLNDSHVRYLVIGGYAVALHGYPPNRIDIITTPPGVDFEACYASRVEVEIYDVKVSFIDLENLRKSKKAAGRLQDLADLENLA
jgi:hypothetical protein